MGEKKKHQKSVTRHFSQSFQPKHDILRYQEKTKGCKYIHTLLARPHGAFQSQFYITKL